VDAPYVDALYAYALYVRCIVNRSARLFEIIQLLRGAKKSMTAEDLARELEVTKRTIYRDIVTLQGMQIPIDGEAGIGYIMRAGFDLPPLMFTVEEIEAISVGLSLLHRTGDASLEKPAESVIRKIADVLPRDECSHSRENALSKEWFYMSDHHEIPTPTVDIATIRRSVREEKKLTIAYRDVNAQSSTRTVLPLAVVYYVESLVLAAWCELRQDFRHFRLDRITHCAPGNDCFHDRAADLRQCWRNKHQF